MKKHISGALRLSALMTGLLLAWQASAAEQPKELNLGILGGQNATQQIGDNQCVKEFLDKELSVDTKLRNSSDYSGVIRGSAGRQSRCGAEHVAFVLRLGVYQQPESGRYRRHRRG